MSVTIGSPKNKQLSVDEIDSLTPLEQLTAKSGQLCPNTHTPILIGKVLKDKEAWFFRAPCKQWKCPVCSLKNANRWIAIMLYGMNEIGGDWFFVTFTAHEKWRKDWSLVNLRKNWPKLRKRLARKAEGELFYAWVYEPHKDRSWHVHLLTNLDLGTQWWKRNARECGMGHQAKAKEAFNPGMVAGYVAKYMLKASQMADRYPKHMRRITLSRNWPKKDLSERETSWDFIVPIHPKKNPLHVWDEHKREGWKVHDPARLRYDWYPAARE